MNGLRRQAVPSSTASAFPAPYLTLVSASSRRIVAPVTNWRETVEGRLNELCRLEMGWDGYMAGPVTFQNAYFALRILEGVCSSEVKAPFIVPGPNGDLQIEWHVERGDIELHVRAPNDVTAYRRWESKDQELNLTSDFTLVSSWISEMQMQDRTVAPIIAAA